MIGFLLFLLVGFWAQVLGRNSDFEVYYNAGLALRDLGWSAVYAPEFVTPFKYHPAITLFFVPFAFFSWPLAKFLWALLNVAALWDTQRRLQKHFAVRPALFALAALFALHALTWQWKFANVTFLMLWLWVSVALDRGWTQAMSIALLLALKPTWLVVAPLLLWARDWRAMGRVWLFLFIFTALPFLWGSQGVTAYEQWWATLVHPVHDHNFPKNDNQCWYANLYRWRETLSPTHLNMLWLAGSGAMGLAWLYLARRWTFATAAFAMIAVWLWAGPMSWIHHQILLIPLVAILLLRWRSGPRSRLLNGGLIALWLLLNGTGEGLLGRELFVRVHQWGLPILGFPLALLLAKFVRDRQQTHA